MQLKKNLSIFFSNFNKFRYFCTIFTHLWTTFTTILKNSLLSQKLFVLLKKIFQHNFNKFYEILNTFFQIYNCISRLEPFLQHLQQFCTFKALKKFRNKTQFNSFTNIVLETHFLEKKTNIYWFDLNSKNPSHLSVQPTNQKTNFFMSSIKLIRNSSE